MKDSSKVSWAHGANLPQVKLSVQEDCRLKVDAKSKTSRYNVVRSKNHLAWYVALNANPSEEKLSLIPQIKWKCPSKFVLNNGWRVAAGEGSHEREAQKYREAAVLEAVYSHLSAIPPSPPVSLDMGGKHYDDSHIPIIPIIPIEEAAAVEMPFDTSAPVNTCINSQPPGPFRDPSASGSLRYSQYNRSVSQNSPINENSLLNILCGLEGSDLAVAAAAAAATVAAVIESKQQIDTELLIKFLSDPEMVKKLMNENRIGTNTKSVPLSSSTPDLVVDISRPVAVKQSLPMHSTKVETAIKKSAIEQGATHGGRAPICTSEPLKMSSPTLRSNSLALLTKNVTNEARGPEHSTHSGSGINQVKPLIPPTLNLNEDKFERIINRYGVPNYPSTSKPNMKAFKPMINEHRVPENAGHKPYPLMLTDIVMPCAKLHALPNALESNLASTGILHSSPFSSMTISSPPVEDINYCKSLIKQHGEKHETEKHKLSNYGRPFNDHFHGQNRNPVELNPRYQMPCMYFNSCRGCRNGSDCPYMHVVSGQWMAGGLMKAPVAKKMKYSYSELTGKS